MKTKFGGNVNEPFKDGKADGLTMRAEPGKTGVDWTSR